MRLQFEMAIAEVGPFSMLTRLSGAGPAEEKVAAGADPCPASPDWED
jgi:hypothetical protein